MPSEDLQIDLELGHWAAYRDEPTEEQYTHDWKFYVKGKDDHDTTKYINKVVFKLHETFPNPIREFRQPPYEVRESGYGGFVVTIDIYLKKIFDVPQKKISLTYDLYLPSQDASPVTNKLFDKLTFKRPSEELRNRLLKCGAYPVAVHPDSTTHTRQVSEKPKAVVVPQPKHSISSESEAEDALVSRSVSNHPLSSEANRNLSGSSKTKASKTTSGKSEVPPISSNNLNKEKSAEKRKPEAVTNSNSEAAAESFGGGGIFSHAGKSRTSSSERSGMSESSRNEEHSSVKKQKIDNVPKPSSKSSSHRESKLSTSTSGSEHGKSEKSSHHRSSERSESSSKDKISAQRSHLSSKKTSSSSEEQSHNQVKSRSSSSTSPSKHRHHDKSVKGSMDKEKLEDNKTSLSLTASLSLSDDSMGSVPSCTNVDDLNVGSVSPFMTSGEVDDGFSQPLDRLLENMTSDLDGISDSVGLSEIKKEPGVVKNSSKALSEKENKNFAAKKMKTGKESEADVNRKSKEISGQVQKIEKSKVLDKHSSDHTDLSISSHKVRAVSSDSAAKESNVKQEKQKTKSKSKDESETSAKVENSSSALQKASKSSKLKESDMEQKKTVSEVTSVTNKTDKEEKELNDKSASSKISKVSENPQKRSKSPAVVASSTDAAKSSQSLKPKKIKENTDAKQEVRSSTDKSNEKSSADKSSSASKMSADSTKNDKSDTSRDVKNVDSTQRVISDGNRDVSASGIASGIDPNTYRAPNGETLSALIKIQQILMDSNDRDLLQEVVDIIENTGKYQLSSDTFDFDLCSLDAETLGQIKKCMKLPDS